jgi:thioester reductase-like protein
MSLGYSQSKWVAERMVSAAGAYGMDVGIYRLPLIGGSSTTGAWIESNVLCRVLEGCLQIGCVPDDLDLELDLAPIDFVSAGIALLSEQAWEGGSTFHLNLPERVPWSWFIEGLTSHGHRLDRVSFDDWRSAIQKRRSPALLPFLPILQPSAPGAGDSYIELQQALHRPRIDCLSTQEKLNGLGSPLAGRHVGVEAVRSWVSWFLSRAPRSTNGSDGSGRAMLR